MNICKCENGHFYDVDNYTNCPHCNTAIDSLEYNIQDNCLVSGTLLKQRYSIKRVLGIGGFGITYKGYDLLNNNDIAIKEYYPSNLVTRKMGQNEIAILDNSVEFFIQGLNSFLAEANRMKTLSDIPGVVNIGDCFEENNTGYIIMEVLDGSTLKEILNVNGKLSYDTAKQLISTILSIMHQVHNKNIIHCDLSPNNIFVTKKGQVKVIDFGVSRSKVDLDHSYSIMITVSYAAPEQYSSKGQIGTWTDVYSIAAIFYYMITNVRINESIERLSNDQLENPSVYCDEIPQKDANAIMHALAPQIKNRTKSIPDLADELGIDFAKLDKIRFDKILFVSNKDFEKKIEFERKCNLIDQIDKNARKGVLSALGFDTNKIHGVDIEKIPYEKQAYNMLLNQFKALDEEHRETLDELNNIRMQTESRKFAAIIITIAGIITSIGISVFPSSVFAGCATFGAGVIMTALGLYMTYKKI